MTTPNTPGGRAPAARESASARPGPDALAPGGPVALARGCSCSVLANAGYRTGASDGPHLDPACALHPGATVADG